MSSTLRTQIPSLIASFVVLFLIVEYFIDAEILRILSQRLQTWAVVIAAFAMGVGIVLVITKGIFAIRKREKDWPYDLWCLILMFVMIVTGLIGSLGTHPVFVWLYNNAYYHLTNSIYSLLAFFITTASLRAFRARSVDTTLVLISGIFVILTMAPIGAVIWSGIPIIGNWFINVPNVAGMRAILIGAALGMVALGVRTILGYERAHLGG